jgi:DNA-binding transcriptional regulator YhcF (GntR family)
MSSKIKRARRHQTRHRSNGPNFIQLFRYMLDSPAYVSLSTVARAAFVEIARGYNGSNNGRVILSVRDLAMRLGCHRDTASHALQELIDKGFIEPRIKGAYSVKFRRATEWRLNDRRCDATGKPQSQAFLKWNPPQPLQSEAKPRKLPWQDLDVSRATYYRRRKVG